MDKAVAAILGVLLWYLVLMPLGRRWDDWWQRKLNIPERYRR